MVSADIPLTRHLDSTLKRICFRSRHLLPPSSCRFSPVRPILHRDRRRLRRFSASTMKAVLFFMLWRERQLLCSLVFFYAFDGMQADATGRRKGSRKMQRNDSALRKWSRCGAVSRNIPLANFKINCNQTAHCTSAEIGKNGSDVMEYLQQQQNR